MLGNNFSNRLLVAAGAVLGLATQSYAITVNSKILILARDDYSASTASSGLNGYGIPFQSVIVPKEGITLPQLKGSSDQGNYGGIIVMGAVSYDYDGTWGSALTTAQWDALYAYQTDFKVRMVRADEFPGPAFGKYYSSQRRVIISLHSRLQAPRLPRMMAAAVVLMGSSNL